MNNTNVYQGSVRFQINSILERLPEKKLNDALAYLKTIDEPEDPEEVRRRKHEAFLRLEQLRRPIPNLDDKKELAEWREERYGIKCTD